MNNKVISLIATMLLALSTFAANIETLSCCYEYRRTIHSTRYGDQKAVR